RTERTKRSSAVAANGLSGMPGKPGKGSSPSSNRPKRSIIHRHSGTPINAMSAAGCARRNARNAGTAQSMSPRPCSARTTAILPVPFKAHAPRPAVPTILGGPMQPAFAPPCATRVVPSPGCSRRPRMQASCREQYLRGDAPSGKTRIEFGYASTTMRIEAVVLGREHDGFSCNGTLDLQRELERRGACVSRFLRAGLTLDAERRLGNRLEPFLGDGLAASPADPIAAGTHSRERVLDRAQLFDVAIELREIQIDQEIRNRAVIRIRSLLDQVGEPLILVFLELAADIVDYRFAAPLQDPLES